MSGGTAPRRRGWGWPFGLTLALLASAGLNIAFALVATHDASFAVEPDYYRKALEWDRTMAQEAANRALGWRITVAAEPAPRPGTLRLVARITDRDGRGVDGAAMSVEARHGARAAAPVSGTLAAVAGGRYVADLPLRRAGLWELRFVARRDGDLYTQHVASDLPGAP
jgi:nitrogen fixation protein FixH